MSVFRDKDCELRGIAIHAYHGTDYVAFTMWDAKNGRSLEIRLDMNDARQLAELVHTHTLTEEELAEAEAEMNEDSPDDEEEDVSDE